MWIIETYITGGEHTLGHMTKDVNNLLITFISRISQEIKSRQFCDDNSLIKYGL